MNFFHNRIAYPTGDAPTFDQWLEQFLNKSASTEEASVKTASEAKPGTGLDMSDEPRGAQRGQVINNDNEEGAGQSYQDGESVKGKSDQGGNARKDNGGKTDQKKEKQSDKEASRKVKAKCGKEMGESSDAGNVTEDHSEAGPGNDDDPDPKILINNDPNYQKGESTDPAKATGDSKKGPGDSVVGKGKGKGKSDSKKASSVKFEKIASMPRLKKLYLFAQLSSNKDYLIAGDTGSPLDYIESLVGLKFANMTDEEKKFFKNFWLTQYDEEYVGNMVKDR